MKYIFVLGAVAIFATVAVTPVGAAHAQGAPAEDSVKTAVNLLFKGMIQSDPAIIRSSFTDSAILQTIVEKDGKTGARTEGVEDFAKIIASLQKGDADERITFDVVRVDGPLAIVWAQYSFYYKGKFSHCGVDSFQLLRVGGVWKIQYLIDTRRKQGCQ